MKAKTIAEKPWDDRGPEDENKIIKIVNKDEMMGTTMKFKSEIE
jgi:hypothetical protein